jgi:hypothetical protein
LKARDGDRAKKLFQFLNDIGARALRIQLGRVLEMAESSSDKFAHENKIAERFGGAERIGTIRNRPVPDEEAANGGGPTYYLCRVFGLSLKGRPFVHLEDKAHFQLDVLFLKRLDGAIAQQYVRRLPAK